ncbi:hypothetical protein EYF80_038339 [Liparis tanakae]|uniref:Uncharacterized protein n=1 Tax=Liparis tanakae TaxID=230148 RepID=A0A4Z2GDR1_9TELE|nr:hypothetical protein EYF80_038339 [Liparis tanakae]
MAQPWHTPWMLNRRGGRDSGCPLGSESLQHGHENLDMAFWVLENSSVLYFSVKLEARQRKTQTAPFCGPRDPREPGDTLSFVRALGRFCLELGSCFFCQLQPIPPTPTPTLNPIRPHAHSTG